MGYSRRNIVLCLTSLILVGCSPALPQWHVEVTSLGPVDSRPAEPPAERPRVTVEQLPNGKVRAVVDGKAGPEFDMISGWFNVGSWNCGGGQFVAPGGRLVYSGRNRGKWVVILDGKSGPPSDTPETIVFSRDGKRSVYVVNDAGKCRAVIDGNVSPEYEQVEYWGFTPEDRPFYIAKQRGQQFLVVDGQAGQRFKVIYGAPVFSADGKRTAYVVGETEGEREFQRPVIDGKVGPRYHASVSAISFSPDGKRVAYAVCNETGVADNRQGFVILDGRDGPPFESVSRLTFSPDSRHLAYAASTKEGERVVLDHVAGPAWPALGFFTYGPQIYPLLVFSPDSRRLAYLAAARLNRSSSEPWALQGQELIVVVDGQPQTKWKAAQPHSDLLFGLFSSDSRHFAFVAEGETQWKRRVVVDGHGGPEFDWVSEPSMMRFLPDGSLEYEATKDERLYRVRHFTKD
jgi:hypothetical protein